MPTPFDPDNPNDAAANALRIAVLDAALSVAAANRHAADVPPHIVLAGLLVGVVQVMQATVGDGHDAAIRASIMQAAPRAVDTALAMRGRGPLSDDSRGGNICDA